MRFVKLIIQSIIFFVGFSTLVQAQENQKVDLKLYTLGDISEIDTVHLHTYYKIKTYYEFTYGRKEYFTSFENNDKLIYQLFVVCPVYDKSKAYDYTVEDTLMMFQNEDFSYRKVIGKPVNNKVYAYIGYVFEKIIDVNLTASQKEQAKEEFSKNALSECYVLSFTKKIQYLERIDTGYEYESYLNALKISAKQAPIIFIPKYEPFK